MTYAVSWKDISSCYLVAQPLGSVLVLGSPLHVGDP